MWTCVCAYLFLNSSERKKVVFVVFSKEIYKLKLIFGVSSFVVATRLYFFYFEFFASGKIAKATTISEENSFLYFFFAHMLHVGLRYMHSYERREVRWQIFWSFSPRRYECSSRTSLNRKNDGDFYRLDKQKCWQWLRIFMPIYSTLASWRS